MKTTLKEVTWKRHLTDEIEEVLRLELDTYNNEKDAVEVAEYHLKKAEAEYEKVRTRSDELSKHIRRGTRRENTFNKYINRKLDKYGNFIKAIFVIVTTMALIEAINGLLSYAHLNPFKVGEPVFFKTLLVMYFLCGAFGIYRSARSLYLISQGITKKEEQEHNQLMIKSAELWTKIHELRTWLQHEKLREDYIRLIQEVEDAKKRN